MQTLRQLAAVWMPCDTSRCPVVFDVPEVGLGLGPGQAPVWLVSVSHARYVISRHPQR
jgi:hypothetical protein